MSIPENGELILLPKGCFSIEFSYFYWVFYQGFCELFILRMNKINYSDDYFLLTINTILLPFMLILWNESGGKCLHTLHND